MNLSDYAVSVIRTVVAIVVGTVVSWAVRHGFDIDKASAVTYVTPLAIGGYYVVVRAAEKQWPKAGILFGIPKAPAYPATTPPAS